MASIFRVLILSVFVQTLHASNGTVGANMSTVSALSPNLTDTSVTVLSNLTTELNASRQNEENRTTSTEVTVSTLNMTQSTLSLTLANGTSVTNQSESTTSLSTVSEGPVSIPLVAQSTPLSTAATSTAAMSTAGSKITSGRLSSTTESGTTVIVTSSMTSSMTSNTGPPSGINLAIYIAIGIACGLVVLVVVFAVVVWCLKSRKHRRGRRHTGWSFDEDEMGKVHHEDRMSMHRPHSATIDAENEIGFVTFNIGNGEGQVGGIVNPTFSLPTVDEDEKKTGETPAGEGGHDTEVESATMPSHARPSVVKPLEGAAATDEEEKSGAGANTNSKVRPQSGFSYGSADIDIGLDELDTDTT